jgi:hypothetical protein
MGTSVAGSLVTQSSGGSGSGSISTITTATPGTVTIVNPTGPSTEIDVTVNPGTINDLTTSTPSTVTITNPTGPTTDIAVSVTPGVADLTTTMPATVIISNPTGPITNVDIVTSGPGGVLYSANAPGATPLSAVSLLSYNEIELTGLAANITDMSPSVMPTAHDYVVRMWFTDNGTPRTITWGSDYEASTVLPTTTVANVRLDVIFYYDAATGKLRCVGVSALPVNSVYQSLAGNVALSATPAIVFNPTLGVGVWLVEVNAAYGSEASAGVPCGIWLPATPSGTATYTIPATNAIGSAGLSATPTVADNQLNLSFHAVVTVTVAGTVQILAAVAAGSTGSPVIRATQGVGTGPTVDVSSVTCVQIG